MERSLPAEINAERAVLGSCLLEPDAILAIGWLKPGAFYLQKHEHIFKSVLACVEQGIPPDMTTVYAQLRQSGQIEGVGGVAYLGELAADVPNAVYVEYYARIVEQAAVRRRIIQASGQIAALAYDESTNLDALIGQSDALLEQAVQSSASDRYAPLPLENLLKRHFPPSQFLIPGLLCEEGLTLLGGKPKMKKSWLALGFGIAVACGGRALGAFPVEQGIVLHLCLEDRERRLKNRADKLLAGGVLPSDHYFYQTEWPRLNEGGLTRLERWMKDNPGTRLIIIDTLKKIKPRGTGGRMYDEDYDSLEPLQIFACRNSVALLVVHHFNQKDNITDPLDYFSGSSGLTGGFDNGLGIIHDRMTGEGTLFAIGRDFEEDRELAIRWDQATAQWSYLGEQRDVQISAERQAVLDTLDEGASLHYKEIAQITGQKPGNCKQLCKRMTDEGLLQRNGPGIYGAAVNDQRTLDEIAYQSGDPVIGGDPTRITAFSGIRTPQNTAGDPVIANFTISHRNEVQNPDHRITSVDLPHSNGSNGGDPGRITADHRITNIDLISLFYGALDIGDLNQAGRLLIKLAAGDAATYRAARKALEQRRSEIEHGLHG